MAVFILEERACIITGAASGLGRALAMEAGARGMRIAIADVNADGLAETERMLVERQVEVFASLLDVRDADAVEAFAAACFARFSSIALMWANAGIHCHDSAIRPDLAAWNTTIDVNLRGAVHCMAAFVGRMVDRAEPARFIVTGSQGSFVGAPGIGAYIATKHALWGLVDSLRLELAESQSPVSTALLAPPRVATQILDISIERVRAQSGEEAVTRYLAGVWQPDDIARIAMNAAIVGEPMIVPGNEIAAALRHRVASLI